MGHFKDPEPRPAFDCHAAIQADASRRDRAYRGAAPAQTGGAEAAAPGQHARKGDR